MPEFENMSVAVELDATRLKSGLREMERETKRSAAKMSKAFAASVEQVDRLGEAISRLDAQGQSKALAGASEILRVSEADAQEFIRRMDQGEERAEKVSSAARRMGASIAGAFERAALSAGNLSDLLQGLAGDLQRTLFRELVSDNLSTSIAGFIQSGFGAYFGAQAGQSGGIIGTTPLTTRTLSVAAFAGAPHFAQGGIVGRQPRLPSSGEVAAVLHKGEMVLTRNDQAGLLGLIRGGGGGARPVNLTINMPVGTSAGDARASAGQIGAEIARQLRLHDLRNN